MVSDARDVPVADGPCIYNTNTASQVSWSRCAVELLRDECSCLAGVLFHNYKLKQMDVDQSFCPFLAGNDSWKNVRFG